MAWFEGVEYEGEWEGGVMHGRGRISYALGEEWEGDWVGGRMQLEALRRTASAVEEVDGEAVERMVSHKMGGGLKGEEQLVGGELLTLLSQVVDLQSQLQHKLSRVEALLVTPKVMHVEVQGAISAAA